VRFRPLRAWRPAGVMVTSFRPFIAFFLFFCAAFSSTTVNAVAPEFDHVR
jgi:hypothetical protein